MEMMDSAKMLAGFLLITALSALFAFGERKKEEMHFLSRIVLIYDGIVIAALVVLAVIRVSLPAGVYVSLLIIPWLHLLAGRIASFMKDDEPE